MRLSLDALGQELHAPATQIREIVEEPSGITADVAAKLARRFGTTIEFWLNLQRHSGLSSR